MKAVIILFYNLFIIRVANHTLNSLASFTSVRREIAKSRMAFLSWEHLWPFYREFSVLKVSLSARFYILPQTGTSSDNSSLSWLCLISQYPMQVSYWILSIVLWASHSTIGDCEFHLMSSLSTSSRHHGSILLSWDRPLLLVSNHQGCSRNYHEP